jgi:hypothetical protein
VSTLRVLRILESPYLKADSPPRIASTTPASTAYDGWAVSACGCDWQSGVSAAPGIVVVDDRLAANPINRVDPTGLETTSSIKYWLGVYVQTETLVFPGLGLVADAAQLITGKNNFNEGRDTVKQGRLNVANGTIYYLAEQFRDPLNYIPGLGQQVQIAQFLGIIPETPKLFPAVPDVAKDIYVSNDPMHPYSFHGGGIAGTVLILALFAPKPCGRTPPKNIFSACRQPVVKESYSQIKSDMLANKFMFSELRARIGGFVDNVGNYYVNGGHTRMRAAIDIFIKTGDDTNIIKLLENGAWDPLPQGWSYSGPLP